MEGVLLRDGRCNLVAEVGINHNGNLGLALKLMHKAKVAGFDVVKFQKRTIDVVYTKEELDAFRESPFANTELGKTNRAQKLGLEFDRAEFDEIDRHAKAIDIAWTASPWDEASVDFLMRYDIPYIKIASASVTDSNLIQHCCETKKPLWISTGMCDLDIIKRVVDLIEVLNGNLQVIYHCTSTYPCPLEDINLRGMLTLQHIFPEYKIGYSGHETGVAPSLAAAVLGAASVERHITESRALYGSDQAASLEPKGFTRLCRDIRDWERFRGDGQVVIYDDERPIIEKLRRKDTL